MNQFYKNLDTPIKQDSEAYGIMVDLIQKLKKFTIDDIYKGTNKKLPKGGRVDRYKVTSTLRVLLKEKLLIYKMDEQLIYINSKTQK